MPSELPADLVRGATVLGSSFRSAAGKWSHFLNRVKSRTRARRLKRDAALLEQSGLFDRAWYLQQHPDVAEHNNVDPVSHYLQSGAREGRDPSPTFSSSGYLETYPDVLAHGMNPLLH